MGPRPVQAPVRVFSRILCCYRRCTKPPRLQKCGNVCLHGYYILCNIILQRETEEKARQPETKLGASSHTRHKARLRNAKRSLKKPKIHKWGAKSAYTTSAEGRARPRIRIRPEARVATYAPERHRVSRQRATPRSQSAPEMKAARERPGPPACTAWSAKSPSSVKAGPQGARRTGPTSARRAWRRTLANTRAAWRRPGQRPQTRGCAQRPQQRTQPPGG
jgi:hypothetical protein